MSLTGTPYLDCMSVQFQWPCCGPRLCGNVMVLRNNCSLPALFSLRMYSAPFHAVSLSTWTGRSEGCCGTLEWDLCVSHPQNNFVWKDSLQFSSQNSCSKHIHIDQLAQAHNRLNTEYFPGWSCDDGKFNGGVRYLWASEVLFCLFSFFCVFPWWRVEGRK